jgi:hypothetical protein
MHKYYSSSTDDFIVMIYKKKSGKVGTALLNSKCQVGHINRSVKFKFNNISLYTKIDSERR